VKKNMKLKTILFILTVMLFVAPVLADNGLPGTGAGTSWYGAQSADFHTLIQKIDGAIMWVTIFAFVGVTLFQVIRVSYEGTYGSQATKAAQQEILIRNFVLLVIAVAIIIIVPSFVPWF
jgi:hypothetical protein